MGSIGVVETLAWVVVWAPRRLGRPTSHRADRTPEASGWLGEGAEEGVGVAALRLQESTSHVILMSGGNGAASESKPINTGRKHRRVGSTQHTCLIRLYQLIIQSLMYL